MRKQNSFPWLVIVLFGMFASMGVSNCAGVRLDSSKVFANEANDYTGLVEGCGLQLNDGFIVCRKTEGDATGEKLVFVAPPAKCQAESCVSFKVFDQRGAVVYGDVFPKGKTRIEVPWEKLLNGASFQLNARGFWGFVYAITFTGVDGIDRTVQTEGEIYLRVLRKDYTPLHDVSNDANFVWNWVERGVQVRMTTAGRVHVDRKNSL